MSKDYVWQGLEDGEHNVLKCISCDKDLADVWVTQSANDISFNYLALCPFCNEQSQIVKITGLVHIGSVEGTQLKDMKTSDGVCVIHLSKEN